MVDGIQDCGGSLKGSSWTEPSLIGNRWRDVEPRAGGHGTKQLAFDWLVDFGRVDEGSSATIDQAA